MTQTTYNWLPEASDRKRIQKKTIKTLTGVVVHIDKEFGRIVVSPSARWDSNVRRDPYTGFQVYDLYGNLLFEDTTNQLSFFFDQIEFLEPNLFITLENKTHEFLRIQF